MGVLCPMGLVTLPERWQALKAQMRSIVCAGNNLKTAV